MSMSTDPRKEKGSHAYSLISIMPTAGFGSSNISESKKISPVLGLWKKSELKKSCCCSCLFQKPQRTTGSCWPVL